MSNKGAFVDACKYIIEKDFNLKIDFMKAVIANPKEYPVAAKFSGAEWLGFVLGDYQRFADKWKDIADE